MLFSNTRYLILLTFLLFYTSSYSLFASDYKDITDKVFSDRKIDTIEGIWVKTYANQGPTGAKPRRYTNLLIG